MKIPKLPAGRVKDHIKLRDEYERTVDKRGKHSKEAKQLGKKLELSSAKLKGWLGTRKR